MLRTKQIGTPTLFPAPSIRVCIVRREKVLGRRLTGTRATCSRGWNYDCHKKKMKDASI